MAASPAALLIFLLALLVPPAGAAQPPGGFLYEVFGPPEGMPGGQIRALAISPENALFVGTESGAARFDGQRFHPIGAPPELPAPYVVGLHATSEAVYVQCAHGMYRWYEGDGELLLPQNVTQMKAGFAEGPAGEVYLANEHGVYRIEGDEVSTLLEGDQLHPRAVLHSDEGLWIAARAGLFLLHDGELSKHHEAPVRALLAAPDGVVVGAEDGIYLLGSGKRILRRDCFTTGLAEFREGRMAASCGLGVRLQAPDGSWESFTMEQGLPGEIFTRAAVDQEGTLWLATLDQGLLRVDEPDLRLWGAHTGLGSNRAGHLYGVGEELYLTSNIGGWAIGPDLQPRPLVPDRWLSGTYAIHPGPDGLYGQAMLGFVDWYPSADERQRFQVAITEELHLMKFPEHGVVGMGANHLAFVEDRDRQPVPYPEPNLVGGPPGPSGRPFFTGRTSQWEFVDGAFQRRGDLPDERCAPTATAWRDQELWVACANGIWREEDGRWERVHVPGLEEGALVRAMVLLDDDLWMASLAGLHRLTGQPRRLGQIEGLPRLSFLWSAMAAQGEWLAMASSQGVVWVRPTGLRPQPQAPAVRLPMISVDGEQVRDLSTLGPGDDQLQVTLATNSLAGEEHVRYRFRLDGEGWSEPFRTPTLQLAGLAAGAHRLEVEASALGSAWSAEPAVLELSIPPFWWERKTVQLGFVLAAFAIAGLIWRERARRLRLQLRMLEEQEEFRQVFGRFVAREVAEEALSGRLSREGENREVTVLFADIRGFTPLSEALAPPLLVELLNSWFTEMVAHVEAEEGVVNKFMGDAIVAIFGAPRDQTNHADRAVRAAVAMMRAQQRRSQEYERRFGHPLGAGIGINSGVVIAGPIGADSRMEYTVIGEAVNIAARVETLTRALQATVLVTGETVSRLKTDYGLVPAGEHRLKGVSAPVSVWRLEG